MHLSLQQLSPLATGCFGGKIENEAWQAQRLPALMEPLYQETEGGRIRLECPTGVRLRFESDATSIRLSLRYGAPARSLFKGNLLVDKKQDIVFGPEEAQAEWSGEIFSTNEKRLRHFDLWLPHLCRTDVRALDLDDGSYLAPVPPPALRWLAYGDSVTQGMTASTPLQTHFGRMANALDAEVFNLGIGGAKLDARLSETVPEGTFDIVSIAYGSNDFNQDVPPEQYLSNAQRLLEALREKLHCPLVFISPPFWVTRREPNKLGKTLDDYRAALAELRDEAAGIYVVAGTELVPEDIQFFVDGVHPNDAGFEKYAANLLPHFRRALDH